MLSGLQTLFRVTPDSSESPEATGESDSDLLLGGKSGAGSIRALFAPKALGDFTVDWRVLILSGLAIIIGVIGAGIAALLMAMIGLITNIAYYHRFSTALVDRKS